MSNRELITSILLIVCNIIAVITLYEKDKLETKYHECVIDHDMAYMISPEMLLYLDKFDNNKELVNYDYE